MSLRKLKREILEQGRKEGKKHSATRSKKTLPRDPVQFCIEWLYYEPFEYMWPFLRNNSHFVANMQARQTGKTFNGMAKLLYFAFKYSESVILVTAPKLDQVKNIAFKALSEHLKRMQGKDPEFFDYVVGKKNILRTVIRFRNGSTCADQSR
mgnify:CR=1 FL=1